MGVTVMRYHNWLKCELQDSLLNKYIVLYNNINLVKAIKFYYIQIQSLLLLKNNGTKFQTGASDGKDEEQKGYHGMDMSSEGKNVI